MNKTLIDNINALVKPGDTLYHLGDFTFRGKGSVESYRKLILCKDVRLVHGNHDQINMSTLGIYDRIFTKHSPLMNIKVEGKHITLCHYPMLTWDKSHYESYQLYGHCHGGFPDNPERYQLDVGVDAHDYMPISFAQVKELMSKKSWVKYKQTGKAKT